MTERLLLVSTCGTSLLTNGASLDDRAWLTMVANEVEVKDAARIQLLVDERRECLKTAGEVSRRSISAELNGIGAALERYKAKQVFHLLIHTDTALGKVSAELVKEALGSQTSLMSAGGLRTSDLASFRAGLADLTKQLDETVQSHRKKQWFVVFNLTGGFKSLNGYLQTVAMITADRCVFLFDGAPELMEIPRLPVRLAEVDELREHAALFRRLAVGYSVKADDAEHAPDSLLMEVDREVTTSVLGDVAWARHRATVLAEKLHPPLSSKVRVSDDVQRAFNKLEASQKVQVNEALDEFSAHIDNDRALPKSRTFKKLPGKPVAGSSYQLYAWSDGATGRLFGHYAVDGVFVFDRLTNHL